MERREAPASSGNGSADLIPARRLALHPLVLRGAIRDDGPPGAANNTGGGALAARQAGRRSLICRHGCRRAKTPGMYAQFTWTAIARERNSILRQYEPLQPFLFYEFAKHLNVETFFDIGANIGAYSLFVASLPGVKSVHAFEPSPETAKELARNIALNEPGKKITVHDKAVSSRAGEVGFGIAGDYSGANSIVGTSIHAPETLAQRITVEAVALDDLFHDSAKVIALKIDVEGHEKDVLGGARALLTGNKAIVQVEDYASANGELESLLQSFGYEKILTIGPECYFTNLREQLADETIRRILENAARALIEANLATERSAAADSPIEIRLLPGVSVQISGRLAKFARAAKRRLGKRRLDFR